MNKETKYYWVNKNADQTEVLYAPAKSGKRAHKVVAELRVGDKVLYYNDKQVYGEFTITSDPVITLKKNDDGTEEKFFEAKADYQKFDKSISLGKIMKILQGNSVWENTSKDNNPFNRKGVFKPKQQYMSSITKELHDLILEDKVNVSNVEQNLDEGICQSPLNQILYGPPGTGKTYSTIIKAMEIIDNKSYLNPTKEQYKELKKRFNKLKKEGRIGFITFHQSYSYEEFVEGIKPDTKEDKLVFRKCEGIFKKIANNALFECLKIEESIYKKGYEWEELIAKFQEKYPEGSELETISQSKPFEITGYSNECIQLKPTTGNMYKPYSINFERLRKMLDQHLKKEIRNASELKEFAESLHSYYYSILLKLAAMKNRITKPNEISSKETLVKNDDFKKSCINSYYKGEIGLKKEDGGVKPYVLIIDEINRGNISNIFGELITLIEKDKRLGGDYELTTTLPYSQEDFGVSNNLYIIGTMNTADKSLALLDVALRRRFDFIPKYPQVNLAGKHSDFLKKLNEGITKLKKSRDYAIGHSFFMEDKELSEVLERKIIPLLLEYFSNETKKVAELLDGYIDFNEVEQCLKVKNQ